MKRGASGSFVERTGYGEVVRAFLPSPLPPDPPIEMTAEMLKASDEAHLACGRLDASATWAHETERWISAI